MYIQYDCYLLQYKKQMIMEQWKENDDYQHIKFQNDIITLDIPGTPPIVDNWKIVPQSPLRVCMCSTAHLQYTLTVSVRNLVWCQTDNHKKILI